MNAPKTVSELFPSKYLKAEDLKNKAYALVIRDVSLEKVHDTINREDTVKAVVWFDGAQKGLILNKTQALALASIAGTEELGQWKGARVHLRPGRSPNGKPTIVISAAASEI